MSERPKEEEEGVNARGGERVREEVAELKREEWKVEACQSSGIQESPDSNGIVLLHVITSSYRYTTCTPHWWTYVARVGSGLQYLRSQALPTRFYFLTGLSMRVRMTRRTW